MEDTRNVRFRVVQISTSFFLVSLFTGALACLSSLCYAGDVKELTLTPEQLKEYRKSYSMPEVRHLRRFLDTYADSRDKIDPNEERAARDLDERNMDKRIIKGKFVVYWIGGFLGGGKSITIVSQEHPEVMLVFWVYKVTNKVYQVRALIDKPDIKDLESFKKKYFKFLHNKHLAM